MYDSFELREKEEEPLIAIDPILINYAKKIKAKIFNNYRDYPSRTIYWKRGRTVKFVQLKLEMPSSDSEINNNKEYFRYHVFVCNYKIIIPFLNFWNARFDVGGSNCQKIGTLKTPINANNLIEILEKSFAITGR